MPTPVTLIPGTLPYADDCYPSPQELNVAIVTGIQAFLADTYPGIYKGASAPPANQRDRLWYNTDSSQWYEYTNGNWMRKYRPLASEQIGLIWFGTEAELATFDGGSAGAVGDFTGPLWQIKHELDGRVLLGAGTIPGTSPAVTVAKGATVDSDGFAGLYKAILVPSNFQHFHGCGTDGGIDDPPNMISRAWSSVKNFVRRINDIGGASGSGWHDDTTAFGSGTMGTTEPYTDPNYPTSDGHMNMQPYFAAYYCVRSARIWVNAPN